MIKKKLAQIHKEHNGYVSDKWELYLDEYDRIFQKYRDSPIRLLEIGIQNGGSLEIWEKYFSMAQKIVGCDINTKCNNLTYRNPKIKYIIGNANEAEVSKKIFNESKYYDIIIDDGSHVSNDIIVSFTKYFPLVGDNGVYVIEDLHCSYWTQLQGGIFEPFSSISFLKLLADIINYEHWGISKKRSDVLSEICSKYGCDIDDKTLSLIHSVEFVNSMCIITKRAAVNNTLGKRMVGGSFEMVLEGHKPLSNIPYKLPEIYHQPESTWISQYSIADELSKTKILISEKDEEIVRVKKELFSQNEEVAKFKTIIKNLQNSGSWRLTRPLRAARNLTRGIIWKPITELYYRTLNICINKTRGYLYKDLYLFNKNNPNIFIHLDKPKSKLLICRDLTVISGWSVNTETSNSTNIRIRIGKDIYNGSKVPRLDVGDALSSICKTPLNVGFVAVCKVPLGINKILIESTDEKGEWMPIYKLFIIRDFWSKNPIDNFQKWIVFNDRKLKKEKNEISKHIQIMPYKPTFSIVIDVQYGTKNLEKTRKGIENQLYNLYDVSLLVGRKKYLQKKTRKQDRKLTQLTSQSIQSDFVIVLHPGECLSPNALYEFASIANQALETDIIYADEDVIDYKGERSSPFYKPAWSPDYLETFNYIGFPSCYKVEKLPNDFVYKSHYDMALRATESSLKIVHLPKILGHKLHTDDNNRSEYLKLQNIEALNSRLARTGRNGEVFEHKKHKGCYLIDINRQDEPLISVVIPTAGKKLISNNQELDLITNVVSQLRNVSTYKNLQIIVVDNGDLTKEQTNILNNFDCIMLSYKEKTLNIPKKLNLGVSSATGEFLLLMNDDIEFVSPDWIFRMISNFEKLHVGVVGAKLVYPNGFTQHVGIVHNNGNPDHVRRLYPSDEAGYFFSTCGVRNYMAVTGAVMMTRRAIYRKVGGYSDELAISYNDADFCLKVRQLGLSIVYEPRAELIHMESVSRIPSCDFNERNWYHEKWAEVITSDLYYNEYFQTLASPTYDSTVNVRLL